VIQFRLCVYVSLIACLLPGYAGAGIDICSCVNDPINTDAKARLCGDLLNGMTPEETVHAKGECNAKFARERGLNICFCLKSFHTDPDIINACENIIGKDTKPSEIARLAANCR